MFPTLMHVGSIREAVRNNSEFSTADLTCEFDDVAALELAQAIRQPNALTKLDLDILYVSPVGAKELSASIAQLPSLETFELFEPDDRSGAAAGVAGMLLDSLGEGHPKLTDVFVESNRSDITENLILFLLRRRDSLKKLRVGGLCESVWRSWGRFCEALDASGLQRLSLTVDEPMGVTSFIEIIEAKPGHSGPQLTLSYCERRRAQQIQELMQRFLSLKKITLSHGLGWASDRQLQLEDVLLGCQNGSMIEELELDRVTVTEEGAQKFAEFLQSPAGSHLSKIILYRIIITRDGLKKMMSAIHGNTTVRLLMIRSSLQEIEQAGPIICELLQRNRFIEELYLEETGLNDESLRQIGTGLAGNPSVKLLALNDNNMESLQALADGIQANTSVEKLKLCGNRIQVLGEAFAHALVGRSAPLTLDLSQNPVNDGTLIELSNVMNAQGCLKGLLIDRSSEISMDGLSRVLTSLATNTKFQDLDLQDIELSLVMLSLVIDSIRSLVGLKYLSFGWCVEANETDEWSDLLLQSLNENRSLETILTPGAYFSYERRHLMDFYCLRNQVARVSGYDNKSGLWPIMLERLLGWDKEVAARSNIMLAFQMRPILVENAGKKSGRDDVKPKLELARSA